LAYDAGISQKPKPHLTTDLSTNLSGILWITSFPRGEDDGKFSLAVILALLL